LQVRLAGLPDRADSGSACALLWRCDDACRAEWGQPCDDCRGFHGLEAGHTGALGHPLGVHPKGIQMETPRGL